MTDSMHPSERVQRSYYRDSASAYDTVHAGGDVGGTGKEWLPVLSGLLLAYGVGSILDVGCATGLRSTEVAAQGFRVVGLDPVAALLGQGYRTHQDLGGHLELVQGSAYALPFCGRSFDAVLEMGMLHHVHNPARVIDEMTRVARTAIVLADSNRFGQGHWGIRWAKLILCKTKLWPYVEYVRTRGRGFHFSEGDGVFYSYSLFDSMPQLARWASRIFLLSLYPPNPRTLLHPILTSPSALLVAIR